MISDKSTYSSVSRDCAAARDSMILNSLLASATSIGLLLVCLVIIAVVVLVKQRRKVMQ